VDSSDELPAALAEAAKVIRRERRQALIEVRTNS
jgi:hypothetical protein